MTLKNRTNTVFFKMSLYNVQMITMNDSQEDKASKYDEWDLQVKSLTSKLTKRSRFSVNSLQLLVKLFNSVGQAQTKHFTATFLFQY